MLVYKSIRAAGGSKRGGGVQNMEMKNKKEKSRELSFQLNPEE